MKDYFKPKTWLIAILMFIVALGFSSAVVYYEFGLEKNIKITRASADDNVSGWAWNANTGWISFNCTEDTPACGTSNYGVSIDLNTGYFSGYAWSSSVGWISFNRRTCVGGSDIGQSCTVDGDCPSSSCSLSGPGSAGAPPAAPYDIPANREYNAIYDFSAKTVTGWAKILAMGDNGWISFNRTTCVGGVKAGEYCIADNNCPASSCSLSGPGGYPLTIDPATGEFSGWAWNANDDGSGIGWISFNCNDAGAGGCTGHDYKVVGKINRPPTVTNLTAPNWSYLQASANALYANLNFKFVDPDGGSFGSAYQIKITKADDTAVLDTGECTGYNTPAADPIKCIFNTSIACMENGSTGCIDSANCVCQFPLTQTDGIWYGTGYKWSVRVWDNYGAASDLTEFDTDILGHVLTDNQIDNTIENPTNHNLTFTTYKHEMPEVDFTWFPLVPSRGEEVQFTDISKVYSSSAPSTAVDCIDSSVSCQWEWSSLSPGVTFKDPVNGPSSPTPIIIFNQAISPTITLKVKDQDGYYIFRSETINVNAKLPGWKEVKPE